MRWINLVPRRKPLSNTNGYCMVIFFLQLGTYGQVQNLGFGLLGRRKRPSLTAIRTGGLLMDRYRTMNQKISITPQFIFSNFILQLSGLKLHLQTLKFIKSLISGKGSGTTEKTSSVFPALNDHMDVVHSIETGCNICCEWIKSLPDQRLPLLFGTDISAPILLHYPFWERSLMD